MSIEETNRLREKLGLKPLDVGNSSSGNKTAGSADFVHAPAEDLWKKKKESELREKLQARKDKRSIEKKYSKVYYILCKIFWKMTIQLLDVFFFFC